MAVYTIASDELTAAVRTAGAELCRLRTRKGLSLLWGGDAAVWARQAPNLFPVVGGLKDDTLRHKGRAHSMPKHGFARDREWTLKRLCGHEVVLRLRDDEGTRAMYPFAFDLLVTFRLDGEALRVQYDLTNPGDAPLLASLGAHPAFRWPLAEGAPRDRHRILFERPETPFLPVLDARGLFGPGNMPSPLNHRELRLSDAVFREDALVFNPVESRHVRYSGPGTPVVEVSWEGFHQLGIWSKPGAGFVCIEPWRGFASPASFDGEFGEKPGVFQVAPGATTSCAYTIRVLPA
ncbi:aldose 1-epimerase family protein [Mesoterricola sediminis]|uniref:Aldose 1-epimerase n=1 Tax=Mesoterricola sediminis TaxID=2927980 RepID=A0AA48H298_9BACT|nr:aldose 1-epimerase family protein [Mesoterricola sediminis]BDU76156.1 aldose 1-epimerase [Mesoterricola sediminis]